MASGTNPTGLKLKGGRLQAFARGISDGDAHYNAPTALHEKPEKRSDTPNPSSSAPTREEIVESARVPLPQNTRRPGLHQRRVSVPKQPLAPSPQKVESLQPSQKPLHQSPRASPADDPPDSPTPISSLVQHRRPLFEGSQLGDNFMKSGFTSGLTTPQNEYNEVGNMAPLERGEAASFYNSEVKDYVHDKLYQTTRDRDRGRNLGPFHIHDSGLISVKPTNDHHPPTYMADGFQNGITKYRGQYRTDHDRQLSPVRRPAKLPIREERLRISRGAPKESKRLKEKPTSPARDFIEPRWQGTFGDWDQGSSMAMNFGDVTETHIAKPDLVHETPEASTSRTPSVKRLMASPLPVSQVSMTRPQSRKRSRANPDYNDTVLETKTFSDLQQEPFDLDPAKTVVLSGQGIGDDSLPKRLAQVQKQSESEQKAYFGSMPLQEWEAAGDWFVDEFSSLMNRFKDARKEKRHLVQDFEEEAAHREEAVRLRSDAIDDKLARMRQDGQRVVGSKAR